MLVQSISLISFEGKRPRPDLKKLWDKGKLPTVKYGFYGDELTWDNISREHLKPASKGGKTVFDNIVLASKPKNNNRGNASILDYYDNEAAQKYLKQFEQVDIPELNGKNYIQAIKFTLMRLGVPYQLLR